MSSQNGHIYSLFVLGRVRKCVELFYPNWPGLTLSSPFQASLVESDAARGYMAAQQAARTAGVVLAHHQELLGMSTRVGPYPA